MNNTKKKSQPLAWSLLDRNFHRQANNLNTHNNLSEVARPWFSDYRHDPQVESALLDLNATGTKRRQALDFLGLDLVPALA